MKKIRKIGEKCTEIDTEDYLRRKKDEKESMLKIDTGIYEENKQKLKKYAKQCKKKYVWRRQTNIKNIVE